MFEKHKMTLLNIRPRINVMLGFDSDLSKFKLICLSSTRGLVGWGINAKRQTGVKKTGLGEEKIGEMILVEMGLGETGLGNYAKLERPKRN